MQARLQAGEGTCGERAAPGGRARTRACPRAQTNTHMYGDMYTHAPSASALLAAMLRYGEWDGVWAMHAIQQAQQSAKHSAQSILRHSERDPAMAISVPPRGHFEQKDWDLWILLSACIPALAQLAQDRGSVIHKIGIPVSPHCAFGAWACPMCRNHEPRVEYSKCVSRRTVL